MLLFSAVHIFPAALLAQKGTPLDCFKAQEIRFPLSSNYFTKSEILMEGRSVNALYYQYQDKYTFWYKFVATEAVQIQFSISATMLGDRYGVTAYRYGKNNFCEKLVNEGLEPLQLERNPIFDKDRRILYVYTLNAAPTDTVYISVLSLNPEDCGHMLNVEANQETLSIHAIHRPCYNFANLEIPDFSAARIHVDDVKLFLEGLQTKETPAAAPETPAPAKEPTGTFSGLSTVVVESAEDDLISVGDRLTLNQVYFFTNTYAFKPESDNELQQLLNFLLDNPAVRVEIQGHTANNTEDIRPDPNFKNQGPEWNFKGNSLKLSEERAKAVRDYLIANGISRKRIAAVGYGDTVLKVPNAATFEDAEKNMRVEVVITGK